MDEPRDSLPVEEVFSNAPEHEGNLFRVPAGEGTYVDNFEIEDYDPKGIVEKWKGMLPDA